VGVYHLKVLLVNPPKFKGSFVQREDRCECIDHDTCVPTISLACLAQTTAKEGHTVKLVDANAYNLSLEQVRKEIEEFQPDFLVFRAIPPTLTHDVEVAKLAKSIDGNITTVMLCFSLIPQYEKVLRTFPEVNVHVTDIFFENFLPELFTTLSFENTDGIAYWDAGEIRRNKENSDYSFNFSPDWSLLPDFSPFFTRSKAMKPWGVSETTRNCPFGCKFCILANSRYVKRPVANVLSELEYLIKVRKLRYLNFYDPTFALDKNFTYELLNEIIRANIHFKWYTNTRCDLLDEDILKRMREAGCRGLSLGIEFGNDEVLIRSKKGSTVQLNFDTIQLLRKVGIKSYGSFVMGVPFETKKQMQDTVDFIKRSKLNGFQLNIWTPYQGTSFYKELQEEGLVNPDDVKWDDMNWDRPSKSFCELSVEELIQFRKQAYHSIYFNTGWLFSNVRWLLRHPEDVRIATSYFSGMMNRVIHSFEFSH